MSPLLFPYLALLPQGQADAQDYSKIKMRLLPNAPWTKQRVSHLWAEAIKRGVSTQAAVVSLAYPQAWVQASQGP